ncbi:Hemin-binding protein [Azospirillaceae bacterium]
MKKSWGAVTPTLRKKSEAFFTSFPIRVFEGFRRTIRRMMTLCGVVFGGIIFRAAGVFGVVGAFALSSALAQQLPPSLDPGRIEQRFEQPKTPQSQPAIEFPAPEQAPPPEQAGQVFFVLTGVAINGMTVYQQKDVQPLYASLLEQKVSLAQIYQLRDALTNKYRNDGYVLSQVVIPAQKITNGVVQLTVLEGYVNSVSFEGKVTDHRGLLQDYADKIKAERPLRNDTLERYVMLANDLPGLTVRSVLKPAEGVSGASDVILTLEEKSFGAMTSVDNRGTRSVGRAQIQSMVEGNNLFGLFDKTTLTGIVTPQIEELRYIDLNHIEPIGVEGTTLSLGYRRNWSEPGDNVRQFKILSKGETGSISVSHPIIRTRSETLRFTGAFSLRNSRTTSFDSQLSDDRLRIASGELSYDFADVLQGNNLIEVNLSHGFDFLNATRTGEKSLSRAGGISDFTKYTVRLQHYQPLPEQFSFVIGGDLQYSSDQLLSSEEFGVGGKQYGRAFDSSEITGDKGWAWRLEGQYAPDFGLLDELRYNQFYVFADYGAVWNYEDGVRHGRQSLASVGAGVRFGLTDYLSANLEIAKPFLRSTGATNDREPRGFFSLTARY